MNPSTVAQLLNAVAQLTLVVEEIKAGMLTQAQAWTNEQANFAAAVQAFDASKQNPKA